MIEKSIAKKSNIGKTIRKLRVNANLTQKELAEKLFISDKAVSKWERGLSYPDVTSLSKLSKLLDVDTDALFIEEEKHLSSTWMGLLINNNKNIPLKHKICKKTIFDIMISYFLLVNIHDILIVSNEKDIKFLSSKIKSYKKYGINILLINEANESLGSKINIFFNSYNSVMYINDLFFIYGVGLTSSFQRAMMDNTKLISLDNPKIPVYFGKKSSIINNYKNINKSKTVEYNKLFRGYIKIDLNTKKNIERCAEIIKIIEEANNTYIYNPIDILKIRGYI